MYPHGISEDLCCFGPWVITNQLECSRVREWRPWVDLQIGQLHGPEMCNHICKGIHFGLELNNNEEDVS